MLDLIIVTIIAIFLLVGFVRGFLREFFGLLGIIIATAFTLHNYNYLLVLLSIKPTMFSNILSAFVTYALSIVLAMIFNAWLMNAIKTIRYNSVDRALGLILGLCKGFCVSYLVIFLIQLFYFSLYVDNNKDVQNKQEILPHWVINAHVHPIFNSIEDFFDEIIPEDFYDDLREFSYSLSESMEKDHDNDHKNLENGENKNQKLKNKSIYH